MAPRKRPTAPVTEPPAPANEAAAATEAFLSENDLTVGQEVKVDGLGGVFVIADIAKDGSVWCSSKEGWRAFRPEWLYPATVTNKRGNTVPGKMPAERRGSRAAWLAVNYPSALAGADVGASGG